MKKLVILVAVGMLIAGAAGCQSRQFSSWRNAPAATTYNGMAAPPVMYSEPGMTASSSPRPAGGCGPGCSSCGGRSPQVLSGPPTFVPGPNAGPGL